MDILSRVLNYESSIFEEYSSKRKDLIENIKNLKRPLNHSELFIFINDIKAIIEPVKTSISAIDHYFTNTDFKNNASFLEAQELNNLFYLFLGLRLNSGSESELTLETEISDSDSEPSETSESVSESDVSSKSSRSVSVTFSNTNCLV